MWDWLVDVWDMHSIIDVGCGDGSGALTRFRAAGCTVMGIEGMLQDDPSIIQHDYETGPFTTLEEFDLCWSSEFVEHVEERYVQNFLHTFARARFVLMTHGEPGQPGYHHVNNQTADYWKGALAGIGYEFDAQLTWQTRRLACLNENPYNHYRRSGLAFRRYE